MTLGNDVRSGLADADNRHAAVHPGTATVFLNAGAGTGKTKTLVDAIVGLLEDNEGLRLPEIAAVTFTEKAAAELKGRLRLELVARRDRSPDRARWEAVLADLDLMRIGTIHSFALSILREYPLEAGCPPEIDVMDDAAHGAMMSRLWTEAISTLTTDAVDSTLARTMYRTLRSRATLRDVVESLVTHPAARLRPTAATWSHPSAEELRRAWIEHSARKWRAARDYGLVVEALIEAEFDELACLPILLDMAHPTDAMLDGDNPSPLAPVLVDLQQSLCDRLLRRWLAPVGEVIDRYRAERIRTGQLMFDDIISLAHGLLTDPAKADVRRRLRAKIRHIFVDEFQDTDARQVGIVTNLLAEEDAEVVHLAGGEDVPRVRPGSLFVVGDRLQSIYGFRGADVRQYERVRDAWGALTGTGQVLDLTTNFRSEPALVDWFNDLFATWFSDANQSNGGYRGLTSPPGWHSAEVSEPDYGPLVTALRVGPGTDAEDWVPQHVDLSGKISSEVARAAEAEAIVSALAAATGLDVSDQDLPGSGAHAPTALLASQPWRAIVGIDRETGEPIRRPITPGDCAILVPAKTGIASLLRELRRQGLPFRVQGSALLHQTPQIIEVARIVRAVADPTDEIAVVEALRTSLLGCSDADLYVWSQQVGRYRWAPAIDIDDALLSGPSGAVVVRVRNALSLIGRWRTDAHDAAGLVQAVLTDTPALDIADDWDQAGEQWGAYTFLLDETRAWQDATGGALSSFAEHLEALIDPESKAPDTSVIGEGDAIEVMTIHQAKGLTFPVVAFWGLSSSKSVKSDSVIASADGDIELSIKAPLQTAGIAAARSAAAIASDAERERLWYVAFTRARSHVIMAACATGRDGSLKAQVGGPVFAALAAARDRGGTSDGRFGWATRIVRGAPLPPPPADALQDETSVAFPTVDEWRASHDAAIATLPAQTYEVVTERAHALGNDAAILDGGESASTTRGEAPIGDAVNDVGANDLGAGLGSAFGSAVHLALQLAHAGFSPGQAAAKAVADTDLEDDAAPTVARFAASCQARLDELDLQPANYWFEAPVADFSFRDSLKTSSAHAVQPSAARYDESGDQATPAVSGLIGTADFVYVADGAVHVLDFKTDRAIAPEQKAAYLRQVAAYRDVIAAATGLAPGRALLCHARANGPADLIG